MVTAKKWLLSLLIGLSLASAALASDLVPPAFPYQRGWLGGDEAYSIPLNTNNRAVWLFGDTYVRHDSSLSRVGAEMIANSLAIHTSDGVSQTINYYWRNEGASNPGAFFSPPTNAWRYWPEDGFTANGKLYVCLIRIQNTGSGALGFREIGVDLATVNNPQDSPPAWRILYASLSSSADIFPGIATVVDGGYVYLFADADDKPHKSNRPIYLARIPLAMLDKNPAAALQYLAAGNQWKPGPIAADAMVIMQRGVTEMTVRWHPLIKRWVEVQISNEFPAHHLWRREAPDLTGPWSEPNPIYTFPEYSPSNSAYGPDRFYYAGKEHIEFLNPTNGATIITYVGNSFSRSDVQRDLNLYRPQAVPLLIDPPMTSDRP